MAPPTIDWTIQHQLTINMIKHRHVQRPVWSGKSLSWDVLSRLFQLTVKVQQVNSKTIWPLMAPDMVIQMVLFFFYTHTHIYTSDPSVYICWQQNLGLHVYVETGLVHFTTSRKIYAKYPEDGVALTSTDKILQVYQRMNRTDWEINLFSFQSSISRHF